MRVAIFGGTGFVGGYLLEALLDAGHEPRVLVRPGSEGKVRAAGRCRLVAGDIGSDAAIRTTLQSCDAAIYNIGILRAFPSQGITFEELQFNGLVRVVDAAKQAGVQRLLLMSANGVKSGGTAYQDTKYRAEQYAMQSPLDVTVFRPSVIFGDPRGTMEFASQLHRDMVAMPLPAVGFFSGLRPGEGKILMSPVHILDVAQAFIHALEESSTTGKIYSLGGPEILSWQDMIQRIASAVGRKKRILPMPVQVMKIGATLLDWLPPFPVTRDQLTMLTEGNTADPADIQTLIGHMPRPFDVDNLLYLRG
jgi:nucleoside-diphosphate-sugar epimerase